MATIALNPLALKDVVMSLGTDDYVKHVNGVTFTPTSSSYSWTGLDGTTYTDTTPATWVCALAYMQDWETVNSLSQYLLEHEGETVTATFKPRSGSGPSFTSTLTITPGAIGGQVGAYATATASLGCTKPVLVPAA